MSSLRERLELDEDDAGRLASVMYLDREELAEIVYRSTQDEHIGDLVTLLESLLGEVLELKRHVVRLELRR